MKVSRPSESSGEKVLEELARKLLNIVREAGEKDEVEIRTAIAQKIKETEVPSEDK